MLNADLSHVALGVADPGRSRRFYEDHVGLRLQPGSPGTNRLCLGADGHVLELADGSGLDHFALEVPNDAERDALIARLEQAGIEVSAIAEDPDHPDGVGFVDPDGHRVELLGRAQRGTTGGGAAGRAPIGLHHITLATADVAGLVGFYVSLLGFVISDRMGDQFTWLRCNREHHTVAIVEGPAGGLDHYCYEIRDWGEIKRWCDDLAAGGVPLSWGPGRHGPGNNLFIMFDDPDGVHIELSCEMERFWDGTVDYGEARDWKPGMRTVNLWGPAPDWRRPLERAADEAVAP